MRQWRVHIETEIETFVNVGPASHSTWIYPTYRVHNPLIYYTDCHYCGDKTGCPAKCDPTLSFF